MDVNDELIACYVDGTASEEERMVVRQYLSDHPEEMERVLFMMDRGNDINSEVEECGDSSMINPLETDASPRVNYCCCSMPSENLEMNASKMNIVKEERDSYMIFHPKSEEAELDDEVLDEKSCYCINEEAKMNEPNVIGHRFMLMDDSVEDIMDDVASNEDKNTIAVKTNFMDRLDDLLKAVDEDDK